MNREIQSLAGTVARFDILTAALSFMDDQSFSRIFKPEYEVKLIDRYIKKSLERACKCPRSPLHQPCVVIPLPLTSIIRKAFAPSKAVDLFTEKLVRYMVAANLSVNKVCMTVIMYKSHPYILYSPNIAANEEWRVKLANSKSVKIIHQTIYGGKDARPNAA